MTLSALSATRCRRVLRGALSITLALAGSAACAADLIVSAAASLTHAFTEIGRTCEAARPGTRVQLNFAASGALLQQIAKGAPVDVFASADQETMDQAAQRQLIVPATRRDFAGNALVVVVPRAAARVPGSLADLAAPALERIALGVPASVPVGRYTKAALERAGLWPAIAPKVVGAQSVRQALDYVARGEVDAGFVYATDAALMPGKVRIAFTVPTEAPVRYPIAAVAGSRNAAAAAAFIACVTSAPAQAVLARHGFRQP